MKSGKKLAAILTAACCLASLFVFPSFAEDEEAVTIEYENLRELLLEGNQSLKDSTDTYFTNLENYQSLIAAMTDERDFMKLKAKQYEDDDETSSQYSQNAANLTNSISQLTKQLGRATSTSGFLSTDKTIDSYVMSAQTIMNSYNQMLLNYNAEVKTAAAAEATYHTAMLQYSSGAATEADLNNALNSMIQEQNQLESYRIQVESLKNSLLTMLGIDAGTEVVIGTIPDPDIEAIESIDLAADLEKAVGNNSSVQSARHTNAYTASDRSTKAHNEAVAEGTVRADLTDSYEQLMAELKEYEAACDAYTAAKISYESLQRKKSAGMLTEAEYLTGEAEWLQAVASRETAAMDLSQAYDSYQWEVKGV